ncbi:hypothetical protein [Vibrio vulnificus]|uniref:hypothetical protein n=1 Tax=Vibrio vulnificus TaxID=672 RepID=UPI001023A046|nr:hypothetical protein [Vibrio vulnificus]EIV8492745.1 hypothetical protein [Vibrio vulnificus]MCU8490160.1 hypothetical protein [Vibrio vulnificus]RZQ00509.1 hypothetical protein D8T65_14775 [Vibrio vulnificus]RZQ36185.1 hypothetical protein D8T38_11065 [Vibrio vulnificus]
MATEYIGFHGTDKKNIGSIKQANFIESTNDDEWLGYGVYFFVEGISDPLDNACEWAKNQAHSKEGLQYKEYAVLKVKSVCSKVLDTTTIEGLKAFNKLREALIEKHDQHFTPNREQLCDNRVMWNLVSSQMNLDAVIHNLYIKNKTQRIKKIQSNVPNTTVMCVKVPHSIELGSIEVVRRGRVR